MQELAELEKDEELISGYFNNFKHLKVSDILDQFYWEDQQLSIFDFIDKEEQ